MGAVQKRGRVDCPGYVGDASQTGGGHHGGVRGTRTRRGRFRLGSNPDRRRPPRRFRPDPLDFRHGYRPPFGGHGGGFVLGAFEPKPIRLTALGRKLLNFWGLAKVRLAKFRSMCEDTLCLHLKECELRFNHRGCDLYKTLLGMVRKRPLKAS